MKNKIIQFLKKNKRDILLISLVIIVSSIAGTIRNSRINTDKRDAFNEGFRLGYEKGTDSGAKATYNFLNSKVIDFDKLIVDDIKYQDSVLANYLNH